MKKRLSQKDVLFFDTISMQRLVSRDLHVASINVLFWRRKEPKDMAPAGI
jgi:hypothetical protein